MDKEYNEQFEDITLLSMKQVMKYLGVSQWVYYKLIRSGALPTVSLGKRRLVRLKTLREHIDKNESKRAVVYGSEFGF